MNDTEHYRALERMYLAAPINAIYAPQIQVGHQRAEISMAVTPALHHSAGAVHGSVYFKMLDDAAFFAANSIVPKTFVLTVSFTTYLTRPVSRGHIISVGQVVHTTRSQIIADAVLYDQQDRQIARGNGIFVRGRSRLADALGYSDGSA